MSKYANSIDPGPLVYNTFPVLMNKPLAIAEPQISERDMELNPVPSFEYDEL